MAAKCREKSDGKAGGEGKLRRRQRHKKKWEVKFQGEADESFDSDMDLYHLPDGVASGAARSSRPIKTEFLVNGRRLLMEIDTGAGYSLISEDEWRLSGRPSLKSTRLKLVTYTGEPVDIKGEFDALVEWESQKKQLPLLVVAGSGPALVGRNWLRAIRIDWDRIIHLPNAEAACV